MTYADNVIKAIREIKSRKGASRPAIKKWFEANTDSVNVHALRTAINKLLAADMIAHHELYNASFILLEAAKAKKPAAKRKPATKKKAASKSKKAAPKKKRPNYYKTINGVKYDKGMIAAADEAVDGAGDGRISTKDAKSLFDEAADGNKYTDVEKKTMAYIRDNYNFTPAGKSALSAHIKKWGAAQANATKAKKKSKKAAAVKKAAATKKKAASKKAAPKRKKPSAKKSTKKPAKKAKKD